MTFKKKGDLKVETFIQPGVDGASDVEIFRVHDIEGHTDYLQAGFEDYQARQLERQSKGRYTLEDAAMLIVQETGADARYMLEKLILAVRNRSLPVYWPNKVDTSRPEKARVWLDEACWDDLNTWLAENEKRIEWRFPEPTPSAPEQAKSEGQEGSAGTDHAALMARHKELTATSCKNPTATLAKEFGISESRVRAIKREVKEKPRSGMGVMAQQLTQPRVHKIGK